MEGDKVLKDSYDYLERLIRANATDKFEIDYSKLDQESSAIIRDAIGNVMRSRRASLLKSITGASKY